MCQAVFWVFCVCRVVEDLQPFREVGTVTILTFSEEEAGGQRIEEIGLGSHSKWWAGCRPGGLNSSLSWASLHCLEASSGPQAESLESSAPSA